MTTKVVDFLNESGGSNFTETAPRPPVYGEENELQSNGGTSTRSGSSHKSHVSSKSHTSSRSGTSGKGDHSHSPATTPRKSNLADGVCGSKSGLATDSSSGGHTITSCGECEEESEMSAPLGFEPEGSAANSPPYSENGTPPHLKWAENLNYLLEDSEGVELFKDFMERELEGGSEELQFWFACQGLKNKIGAESQDTITNIQKAINKRYVRSDKVKCISKDVRKDIAEKVSTKSSVDHCIFDKAQEEVESYMRDVTYPAFLRSDYYVQYVQNYTDSPKSSQSSGSNSARPVSQSGLLPVVHEDKVLESKDLSRGHFSSVSTSSVINKTVVMKKPEAPAPSRRTETVTGSVLYCPRTPSSYPAHVSYAPVSAQDSELQSLSSDALTDDTISVTDSSVDGYPHHLRKKHHRKAMKSLAQQNRELRTGLTGQIIPRTEQAPKDRNIAETDPKRFADLLIEKLSKVFEERESAAKVEEKLRSISISETDKVEEEKLMTSFAGAGGNGNSSKHAGNTSAPNFMPLMSGMEMETAESILDQHCSRIWASSSHQTPSYSPPPPGAGHQSPPPRSKSPATGKELVAARKKGLYLPPGVMSLSASASLPGGAYNSRAHHHKKRGVAGAGPPPADFVPGSSMSFDSGIDDHAGMIVCGTETHRHIHHHHHHHHSASSSRDPNSMKKSMAEVEAQSTWRAENPAAFVGGGEHVGRGRTSTRKGGSAGLRKGSETSSNIDSGISVMFDKDSVVRVPPNWNNPTGEKVMKWMLDSETVQEVTSQDTDRSSSTHRRSYRLNQSTGSTQPSRQSSKSKSSTRSASMERGGAGGGLLLSAWSGPSAPLPNQPFAQDSSMPLPTPPNPTTQLEEAKRRLESQSRGAASSAMASASPVKSKSFAGVPSKEKSRVPPGGVMMPPPPPHTRTLPSARTVPTELDTAAASQTLDSRMSRPPRAAPPATSANETIVGIYMGQEPIPYRHQLPGRAITLAQIKTLVTKRGTFKYFFKRDSDEFGDGAVFEEITDDSSIVPMWQGKIVVKVEKVDL